MLTRLYVCPETCQYSWELELWDGGLDSPISFSQSSFFCVRQHTQDGVDIIDGTGKLVCLENLSFSSLYPSQQQALGAALAEQVSPCFNIRCEHLCGHKFGGGRASRDVAFCVVIQAKSRGVLWEWWSWRWRISKWCLDQRAHPQVGRETLVWAAAQWVVLEPLSLW